MSKAIIIHGLGGLKEQYFPHLAKVCEGLGLEVVMPSFGSYRENTNYEKWHEQFDQSFLQKLDGETIVVANSLGTQFFVKYLAEKKVNVKAYISVAGAGEILNMKPTAPERVLNARNVSETFAPSKNDFEIFKNFDFPKFSFYSDNDRYFEQSNLEKYTKLIDSKPIFLPNRNHFDQTDDGKINTEFLELEDLIKKLMKKG